MCVCKSFISSYTTHPQVLAMTANIIVSLFIVASQNCMANDSGHTTGEDRCRLKIQYFFHGLLDGLIPHFQGLSSSMVLGLRFMYGCTMFCFYNKNMLNNIQLKIGRSIMEHTIARYFI